MAAIMAELATQPALAEGMAAKPVLRVVKRKLLARYDALLAASQAIDRQSPDEAIHALRIEFKKLRYLIAFFLDLLPERSRKQLAAIKKVQAVLGDFNDYSVQALFLGVYLDDRRIDVSRALSGLIAILHIKQLAQREQVHVALAEFFTETRTIEFKLIFDAGKEGAVQ